MDTENNISISGHDYGPLRTYEVIWRSGHVEAVQGHQVLLDSNSSLTGFLSPFGGQENRAPRVRIHGQFGRHWRMVLYALEEDIASIRDATDREAIPGSPA